MGLDLQQVQEKLSWFKNRFATTEYLKEDNSDFQALAAVLSETNLLGRFSDSPGILAGTFPIGLYGSASDIDILYTIEDHSAFTDAAFEFSNQVSGFMLQTGSSDGRAYQTCRFRLRSFTFELFAQNRDVLDQRAFRHLVTEAVLLDLAPPSLRQAVFELKLSGMKTEPAFALELGIDGEGFDELDRAYSQPDLIVQWLNAYRSG